MTEVLLPVIEWLNGHSVILASTSPRRQDLLKALGIRFTVQVQSIDETHAGLPSDPPLLAQQLAADKVNAIRPDFPGSYIIGADTVVAWHGKSVGKPGSADEAIRMLRKLSDHQHQVYTGLAIAVPGQETLHVAVEQTDVRFRHLGDDEINAYLQTGSPLDKAGAYGIQDPMAATFIMGIRGDYYNVVGFPLRRFYELISNIRSGQ
ncbi:MAG: septum formation protein Maf [Bacteroidetes bacterium]|nr:septum formation protein Maf [Bacteroidota bacterium]